MYKYTLIISQYYHSYHQFIVKFDKDTFLESATKFATELMEYKRYEDNCKGQYLGDLDYKHRKDEEIFRRYNINDAGDIYFINHYSVTNLAYDLKEHDRECIRASRGYKKKQVEEDICNHHDYSKVREIVEKHFELI